RQPFFQCFKAIRFEAIIPLQKPSTKNDVAASRQEAFHADNHFSNASKLSALKLLYHTHPNIRKPQSLSLVASLNRP
ncbi:MAG: hypothetical protein ACLSVK_00805, partial [Acutalibacteraceae bacterium]